MSSVAAAAIASVEAAVTCGTRVLPDYDGGSIVNIPATILEAFGCESPAAPLRPDLVDPDHLDAPGGIACLVVDALGLAQLQAGLAAGRAPHLQRLVDEIGPPGQLTSVFPSTTTAALTSLATAQPPASHGILGHVLWLEQIQAACNVLHFAPVGRPQEPIDDDLLRCQPTIHERLKAAGIPTYAVTAAAYEGTAFTDLLQRGSHFLGYHTQSQIPALLISTAAGVVVTRSATGEQLGRALRFQLLGSRRAVTATAGVLTLMAVIPGMPALPFLGLAGLLGYGAWKQRRREQALANQPDDALTTPKTQAEEIEEALPLDVLSLEVGYQLVAAVDPQMGGTLVDRISSLRKQLAIELGIVMPPVHIRDNLQLEPNAYRVLLLGNEIAAAELRPGRLLALDPSGTAPPVNGEQTHDPAFGSPARWVSLRDRELAEALGYTVVDHSTVIATHLAETARRNAFRIVGRAEIQHLFDVFSRGNPKLVEELVPNLLSFAEVLKVVRNLLKEGVSIRDVRSIVEGLIELAPTTRDPEQLTEMIRQRLSGQLTSTFRATDGNVWAMVLDSRAEEMFRRSLREISNGTGGALDPEHARILGENLEAAAERMENDGRRACVITSPDLRRYVRAFVERRRPHVGVLSFREIEPEVTVQPAETVSIAPPAAA